MSTIEFSDGMARSEWDEFETVELFSGDTPFPVIRNERMSAALRAAGCEAYTVVGKVAGELVIAVHDTIPPVGVLCVAVQPGAPDIDYPAFHAGCFNPDVLVWDITYDTDTKKFTAFSKNKLNNNVVVKRNEFIAHLMSSPSGVFYIEIDGLPLLIDGQTVNFGG